MINFIQYKFSVMHEEIYIYQYENNYLSRICKIFWTNVKSLNSNDKHFAVTWNVYINYCYKYVVTDIIPVINVNI